MKNIAIVAALLMMVSTAFADDTAPMVFRQSKDTYSLPGVGTVKTKGCTIVPANMSAKVDHEGKPWLWFVDSAGEVEDGCEIVQLDTYTPTVVVKVGRPVRIAKR